MTSRGDHPFHFIEALEPRTFLDGAPVPGDIVFPTPTTPIVRIAYMVPSNRTAQPNAVPKLQYLARTMKDWFSEQMSRYGFPGRTITYETEPDGVTPKIWVVPVTQDDAFLRADTWGNVNTAASGAGIPLFAQRQNWLLVPEMHLQNPDGSVIGGVALGAGFGSGIDGGVAHIASNALAVMTPQYLTDNTAYAGKIVPEIGPYPLVQDSSFPWFEGTTFSSLASSHLGAAIHEVTHGLGMPHDNRSDVNFQGNLMNNGLRGMRGSIHPNLYANNDTYLSYGMALSLSRSPYLNPAANAAEKTKPTLSVSTSGAVSPVNGQLPITFTTTDPGGLAVALLRRGGNLIDEMILSGTNATRTFNTPWYTPGTADMYNVSVYDAWGNRTNAEVTITPATGANAAPRPAIRAASSTVVATRPLIFSAAGTADDGVLSALRYEWDLDNDGTFDTPPSTSNSFTAAFPAPGTRLVRVRVTDTGGTGASSISHPIPIRIEALPSVALAQFLDDTLPQSLRLTFNKPVGPSLSASDILVRNLTTNQTIQGATLTWDDATNQATLTFPATPLPDGRYTASIASPAVTDRFAVPLDGNADGAPGGDFTFQFLHLKADFNHDATVDHHDFNILRTNFGRTNATFSTADANYDGVTNFLDFQALELQFGKSLPVSAESQLRPVAAAEQELTRPRPAKRPRPVHPSA